MGQSKEYDTCPRPVWVGLLGVSLTSALVLICLWRHGLPYNVYTWFVVILLGLSGWTLRIRGMRGAKFFFAALLASVHLARPEICMNLPSYFVIKYFYCDGTRARERWDFTPGFSFIKDGENTALIESYLGPHDPEWTSMSSLSPHLFDGNDRVHSRNIIHSSYLKSMLELLPTEESRRKVLATLTDRKNHLRMHQSLLLVCLHEWGYPNGVDAESWWATNGAAFYSENDGYIATSLALDWRARIMKRCPSSDDTPKEIRIQLRACMKWDEFEPGSDPNFSVAHWAKGREDPDKWALGFSAGMIWW